MELKELAVKTCEIFQCKSVEDLGEAFMLCVMNQDFEKSEKFCDMVQDLSIDWIQKIYQYYQADRKEKMQDYTPKSLAILMGSLAGDAKIVVDMCAGSGALTIQKWMQNKEQKFELYELDENVLPYLLFNLYIRNIRAKVMQADVLQQEVFRTFIVRKGKRFAEVQEVENGTSTYF